MIENKDMGKMQRVKVKKWVAIYDENNRYKNSEKSPDGEGEFCAWGVACEEFEYGAGTFSTAIIKRDDGSIENVECSLIQFVSPLRKLEQLARYDNAGEYGMDMQPFEDGDWVKFEDIKALLAELN